MVEASVTEKPAFCKELDLYPVNKWGIVEILGKKKTGSVLGAQLLNLGSSLEIADEWTGFDSAAEMDRAGTTLNNANGEGAIEGGR